MRHDRRSMKSAMDDMSVNKAEEGKITMDAMGIKRFKKLRAIFKSLMAGVSIAQACKAANIDASTLWRWRKINTRVDNMVSSIIESRIQMVEDAQFKTAIEGNPTAQIFYLCNRAPDRWKRHDALIDQSQHITQIFLADKIKEARERIINGTVISAKSAT
jgi:transposase-like protein